MENQEIFDTVAKHLIAQGEKSIGVKNVGTKAESSICFYRGENNTKCAVGCLIPDELYDSSIEGEGIDGANEVLADIMTDIGISEDQYGLLINLQNLHDTNEPEEWFDRLVSLADSYSLNTTAIAKLE